MLISDKANYRTRKITVDKEGHYLSIQGSVLQDIVTLNIYATNNRASKHRSKN